LPGDLNEAIYVAERSDVIRRALGDELFDKLLEKKRIEWDRYRCQVTSWKVDDQNEERQSSGPDCGSGGAVPVGRQMHS